MDGLMDFSSHR
uniref:Uncharacterized protein n=1 Tax=Anguilla anguilla TaxID=7936 RepID=A0A0E9VAC1_ANGAN